MTKRFLTLAIALIAAFTTLSAAKTDKKTAADTTVVITLCDDTPMHCASCETRIKDELRFCRGVKDIATSLDDQTVTIRYNKKKTTLPALVKALRGVGYEPRPAKAQAVEAPETAAH